MNSKERVHRAVTFGAPDRIPRDIWILPAARKRYGRALDDLVSRYPLDILYNGYVNPEPQYKMCEVGTYRDPWGCLWVNTIEGIMGQVQEFPLNDLSRLKSYKPPFELIGPGFEKVDATIKNHPNMFILAHTGTLFHRMNWLRNPQLLYIDLLEESPEFFLIRDMIHEYNMRFLDCLVQHGYDAIGFSDDWGSQNSLLISPQRWRALFKPLYREIFQTIKQHGMLVFFHSDGYIMNIIDDLIEIGVDALNCQVACMGVEDVGKRFRGRICFWGEIDRQKILPHGTPEKVCSEIEKTLTHLGTPQGGCIFQAELNADVPFENIVAMFETWERLAPAY